MNSNKTFDWGFQKKLFFRPTIAIDQKLTLINENKRTEESLEPVAPK